MHLIQFNEGVLDMARAYVIRHPNSFTVQDKECGSGYLFCTTNNENTAQLVADTLNNHQPFKNMKSSFEVDAEVRSSIEFL